MGWARALFLATALLAARAGAQDRLALEWQGPAACPTAEAIEAEVTRLVGGTLPPGPAIRATAVASEREAGGLALHLTTEVDGARGERTIEGERCDELAAAAALILALMIDPEAAMRAEPTEPSALAPPPPPPPSEPSLALQLAVPQPYALVPGALESEFEFEPPRTVEVGRGTLAELEPGRRRVWIGPNEEGGTPPSAIAPSGPDPIVGMFGVGAMLDTNTLPNPAGAVYLEGGLGVALIDARVRAVLVFPGQDAVVRMMDPHPQITAQLWAFTAGVIACLHPIDVARWLEICADVEAGTVFGAASATELDAQFGAGRWFGAGGGVGLAWQPEPWFDLEVLAELLGQVGDDFVVNWDREITLYSPFGVLGRFGLAAHVRF